MGTTTGISWTDATINFWTGCKKVSEGCRWCYMYRDKERYGKDPTEIIEANRQRVLAQLKQIPPGSKIFTCSWSDFFIEEADGWREWAWDVIRAHPQFIWQILTKRPERITFPADYGKGWENVWIGVSIENSQVQYPRLQALYDKAYWPGMKHKLFISIEPQLSFISLLNDDVNSAYIFEQAIDWVIVGGESGNDNGKYRYRPAQLEWFRAIVKDCKDAGKAVFIKQMGTHIAKEMGLSRHGADVAEFPEDLQVQQFPPLKA